MSDPRAPLAGLRETLVLAAALILIAVICLVWSAVALPLYVALPRGLGARCGRHGIRCGFRLYVEALRRLGAYRIDVRCLDTLRGGPPVVLAPNHPSLIDALMIIAHDPNIVCVMRSELMNNVFLGAGARLARYIPNDSPRAMIGAAIAELRRGGVVLLFPGGTRTIRAPINPLTASVGMIARHAQVPVQTLLIEQDSPYLGKGWSPFRRPAALPITWTLRLGRRFEPPRDVRAFTAELERYFRAELSALPMKPRIEARRPARSTA
jgi:1-acyl-sn-glycerol-3-phosphate acyltransferase